MSILAVEDALITECRAALGARVRGVESLPGDWDDEMLQRLLRAVPGVFVAFSGGARNMGAGAAEASIDSRWTVITVTGHASGEAARRRGDALQAGAYELITILVARLHGLVVAGVGTLSMLDVANLYTGTVDRKGLAVYALTFSLPLTFELTPNPLLLEAFETFDAQYDVPPHTPAEHPAWLAGDYDTSTPDARDTVALPQT
ncbi:MAG: DUF1834 family protein [Burkholderiaceae bacterium]|jgi:phage gp37-like protein|nr:DUF1834 family protein [Burkholderiaceae bacterium]